MLKLISRTLLFSILSAALACLAPGAHAAKRADLAGADAARPNLPAAHAADLELPELYSLRIVDEEEADPGQAGGGHSGTLTWTLSIDDTTTECSVAGANCSQNVYRAAGACTPDFAHLHAAVQSIRRGGVVHRCHHHAGHLVLC